jgi:hypothetical protein
MLPVVGDLRTESFLSFLAIDPDMSRSGPLDWCGRVSGVIQGKSLAAVAGEETVSRQTIWKQAAARNVRQIIVAAVNRELESIGHRFARLLEVISEALEARLIRVGRDRELMDLGPDHYAQLTAVDRLIRLLTAGRPAPMAAELKKVDGTMTLAGLEARVVGARALGRAHQRARCERGCDGRRVARGFSSPNRKALVSEWAKRPRTRRTNGISTERGQTVKLRPMLPRRPVSIGAFVAWSLKTWNSRLARDGVGYS